MTTIAETIIHIIAKELDHDGPITADTVLMDLGADSLDLVQIAFEIEEALQINQLDAVAMESVTTVGDLIRLVEGMVTR